MREIIVNHQNLEEIAQEILQRGKMFAFTAQGTSMSPFIRDGDMIQIKQQPRYHVGDVVLLKTQFGLLVHRIITLSPAGVLTRGDNSPANDHGPIGLESILGRVIRVHGSGLNFHLCRPFSYLLAIVSFRRYADITFVRALGKAVLGLTRKTP